MGSVVDGSEQIAGVLEAIDQRLAEAGQAYAMREISLVTLKAIEKRARNERRDLKEEVAQAARLQALPATTPEELAEWWVDTPAGAAAGDAGAGPGSAPREAGTPSRSGRRGPVEIRLEVVATRV